jgi:hypothetical protein
MVDLDSARSFQESKIYKKFLIKDNIVVDSYIFSMEDNLPVEYNSDHMLVSISGNNAFVSIGDKFYPSLNKFASVSPYPNWVFDKESLEWRSPIPESKNGPTFNVESEKYKSINEIPRVHIPKIEELS